MIPWQHRAANVRAHSAAYHLALLVISMFAMTCDSGCLHGFTKSELYYSLVTCLLSAAMALSSLVCCAHVLPAYPMCYRYTPSSVGGLSYCRVCVKFAVNSDYRI